MSDKLEAEQLILACLKAAPAGLSISEIKAFIGSSRSDRTLRRRLHLLESQGLVQRQGSKKGTRYFYKGRASNTLGFLSELDEDIRANLLKQIRELWSHTSTALEGNTLSLGDTHFILENGLTVSGKPLKEHQEVIGHAKAIDIVYQLLNQPLTINDLFLLHRAVQTQNVFDVFKPVGAWKVEPNGTYATTKEDKQIFIEYAEPKDVPDLMDDWLRYLNSIETKTLTMDNVAEIYAKLHMGFVHIHPFWDGNGRLARLVANLPILKAGFPPILIPTEKRREYMEILAAYQLSAGQVTLKTGVWPSQELLATFVTFCTTSYQVTKSLVAAAHDLQTKRG